MNWPANFYDRLRSWTTHREQVCSLPLDSALLEINDWWFQCPWKPYYLHWDDQKDWPDPWQLLDDNIYCGLARALGIVYTISMSQHPAVEDIILLDTDLGNLVQVNKGKYILNWAPGQALNIASQQIKINKRLDSRAVHHLMD